MIENLTIAAVHTFGNITVTEKIIEWEDTKWRYTVSGNGEKFVITLLSNLAGHLLAIPFAEEFRDDFTTIALSVPPLKSFALSAKGLRLILDAEGVNSCNAIGHSNGGVYLQNLITHYPDLIEKKVFSHSLTSMDTTDAYTVNASEVKLYQTMRKMLKVLPVSALTFAMGRMVLPKLRLRSGKADTKLLIALCKEDLRKIMKQDFLAMADCMENFLFNHTFTSRPYLSAPEKVLILDSPSDKIANPKQRAQMLKLCPGAKEHHFKSGGHMTMLNCQNEYFSVLRNFLVN